MMLLKQILVTVAAILPIPLLICETGGHVGVIFMLVSQTIISVVVFITYFLYIAESSGISKGRAFTRAVLASLIVGFASRIEWDYVSILASVADLLYGKDSYSAASNAFFLTMLTIYSALSIACSVAVTYWIFRPSQEENLTGNKTGD